MPATICWLMLAADFMLHEAYVRTNSADLWAVLMCGVALTNIGLLFVLWLAVEGAKYRLCVDVLTGVAVAAVGWMWLDTVLPQSRLNGGYWSATIYGSIFATYLLFARRSKDSLRRRGDVAVGAIVLALPLIGFALGKWSALPVVWPERDGRAEGRVLPANHIYLLLDEYGADASKSLQEALRAEGWAVSFKALSAVGDMTLKVIPQMFSGAKFDEARPCGPTIICDSRYSLDFSRVTVSRPDIDVVGFYHPYCAMKGLRTCVRVYPDRETFSWRRWACAGRRYVSRGRSPESRECAELPLLRWNKVVSSAEMAVLGAPFWNEGGVLFAHLPLPHPPGQGAGKSLSVHYTQNIARAESLVINMAHKARARFSDDVAIVIFSDHGLRYKRVCQSTIYAATPCDVGDSYKDVNVPYIVAGSIAVDLDHFENNGQVFQLH